MRAIATAMVMAMAPLLAGCASTPTRFWTIEPVAGIAAVPPARATVPIPGPVQIAAVHLPIALDRLEVVRHDEADRVKILDFDRWSAPPGSLMRIALTQDLAALLPAGAVIYPDAPAPAGTRRLVIDVIDMREIGGTLTMQLSWSTIPQPGPAHQLRLAAPLPSDDVAGQTRALAAMIGDTAGDIAGRLGTP